MTTTTITLTDFLLARIAEREEAARAATPAPWQAFSMDGQEWSVRAPNYANVGGWLSEPDARHIALNDPDRVLARCAAERRIVLAGDDYIRAYERDPETGDAVRDEAVAAGANINERMMRLLAAVHDDHPDFNEEWTP